VELNCANTPSLGGQNRTERVQTTAVTAVTNPSPFGLTQLAAVQTATPLTLRTFLIT